MYYVYILASKKYGTLYIGYTNNVIRRIWQHKNKIVEGFTKKYGVDMLVYFESCEDRLSAVLRERQMKKWNRGWKIQLIESRNPQWEDLYNQLI